MGAAVRTKPYQVDAEINAFAKLLYEEGVYSFLEVGSKFGGSIKTIANALPGGSRIVSVDMNRNGPDLQDTINNLSMHGYDAHLIVGDSRVPDTIKKAKALGPYDAVFIDADHKLEAVTDDWNNYGPMARIVAFHDIAWAREADHDDKRIAVPELWAELKQQYRHVEFKFCPTGNNNGIGVLWR